MWGEFVPHEERKLLIQLRCLLDSWDKLSHIGAFGGRKTLSQSDYLV